MAESDAGWRKVLRAGDVVRSADGTLGRVMMVQQYSVRDPWLRELVVDTAEGAELWNPEFTVRADDALSREEAARLELRGAIGPG